MVNKIVGGRVRVGKPQFKPGQATTNVPKPKSGDSFVRASSDASLNVENKRVQGSFEMETQGSTSLEFNREMRLRAASSGSPEVSTDSSDGPTLQDRLDKATEKFGLKREIEVDVSLGNDTIGLDVEGKATIAANGIEAEGRADARAGVGIDVEGHLNVGIAEMSASANASAAAAASAEGSLKADLTGVNAQFEGKAHAGVSVEAEGSFSTKSVTIGGREFRAAADGHIAAAAEASIEAKGELNARVNTKDLLASNVKLELEGSALAGAQAEASGSVELGPVKLSGSARGHAGVGVGGKLSVGLEDGVLHARVGLDASFGLGIGGDFDASIDLDEIKEAAQTAGEELLEDAGVNVEAVKRNAGNAHAIIKDVSSGNVDTKEMGGAVDTLLGDIGVDSSMNFTKIGTEAESSQKIYTELRDGKDLDAANTGTTVQGFLDGAGVKSDIDFSTAGKDVKSFQGMLKEIKDGKMLDAAKAGKHAGSILGQLGVKVPIELEAAGKHFKELQQAVNDISKQQSPKIDKISTAAQGLIEMAGIETPVDFGAIGGHISKLQHTLTNAHKNKDLDPKQLGASLQGLLSEMGINAPVDFASMGSNSQVIKKMVEQAHEGKLFSAAQIGGALQSMLKETGVESPLDLKSIGDHFDTFYGVVRDIKAGKMPDAESIGRSAQKILQEFDVEVPIDLATYGAHINTVQSMVQLVRKGELPDLEVLGSSVQHLLQDAGINTPIDLANLGKHMKTISNIVKSIKAGKGIDISDLGAALNATLTALHVNTGMDLEAIAQRVENIQWLAQGVIQGTKSTKEFFSSVGSTLKEAGSYIPTAESIKETFKSGYRYLFGSSEPEAETVEVATTTTSSAQSEPSLDEPTTAQGMKLLQQSTTPTKKTPTNAGSLQHRGQVFH